MPEENSYEEERQELSPEALEELRAIVRRYSNTAPLAIMLLGTGLGVGYLLKAHVGYGWLATIGLAWVALAVPLLVERLLWANSVLKKSLRRLMLTHRLGSHQLEPHIRSILQDKKEMADAVCKMLSSVADEGGALGEPGLFAFLTEKHPLKAVYLSICILGWMAAMGYALVTLLTDAEGIGEVLLAVGVVAIIFMPVTGLFVLLGLPVSLSYLACQHCEWAGGLMDVQYCRGKCPRCQGTTFSYAEKISSTELSRTTHGRTVETETLHKFICHRKKQLADIESEWDRVWMNPPSGWN